MRKNDDVLSSFREANQSGVDINAVDVIVCEDINDDDD